MTPQPTRPPALPVFFESGCDVFPRSSTSLWITTARPMMLLVPAKLISWSENLVSANPSSLALTLPRSPTWRTWSFGAPWSSWITWNKRKCIHRSEWTAIESLTLSGLKCEPVLRQPFDKSPFSWIWKPWSPGFRPATETSISTDSPQPFCENVTFPRILFGPNITAIAFNGLAFCYENINRWKLCFFR